MPEKLDHLDLYLQDKIADVKRECERRRRLFCLLRTAIGIAVLTTGATLILAMAVHAAWLYFSVLGLFAAGLVWLVRRFYLQPLGVPITYEQIALYIDEHYPELQNRMVSMVLTDPGDARELGWMVERFLKESQRFVRRSSFSYSYRTHLPYHDKRVWLVAGLLVLAIAPFWLFDRVWSPALGIFRGEWKGVPVDFTVEPGDAKIRRGDDVTVLVRAKDAGKKVSIRWRAGAGPWQDQPMHLGDSDRVHYFELENIQQGVAYRVISGPQRSRVFHLETWIPPEVSAVDLTYYYPDYLDFPPREVPNSGEVVALEGSRVALQARVNQPMKRVTMVFDSGLEVALKREGPLLWGGSFIVEKNDAYHLSPENREGETALFNPTYQVTVQKDLAPEVRLEFPGRDMEVSPMEEMSFDFKVSDDFGVTAYGIRYQVAGKDPVTVPLHESGPARPEAMATHELLLEDLGLTPGDLVTWTVWAEDRKPGRADHETVNDPFFLEVRPYQRRFREAVSDQGAGMQPGMQGGAPDLLGMQKDVLIATWNLRRNFRNLERASFEKARDTIAETQQEILDAVKKNISGDLSRDPLVEKLVKAAEESVAAMNRSEWPEPLAALSEAATHQQTAYQLLLKLEPLLSQVSRSRNSMGSAGAAQRRLAGLDELEMKRNRNFYEDERRTTQQQQAAEQALKKIKDLARRQKMINDEISKLISELEESPEQEQEIKRRLERLREEARKNLEQLDKVQRDLVDLDPQQARTARDTLDEARRQMNQTLENLENDRLQQARASGSRALEDLDRIEGELKNQSRGTASDRMQNLQRDLAGIERKQEEIREHMAELQKRKDAPMLDEEDPSHKSKNDLLQEKTDLAERFRKMMEETAELANLTRQSQESLSRQLGDWLRETSKKGIVEDIEGTGSLLRYGVWENLQEKEEAIARKLKEARESLGQVADRMVADDLEARDRALAELQQLLEQAGGLNEHWDEGKLEDFVSSDYREWLERLRIAEQFLPETGAIRQDLAEIRRNIERFRRDYRRESLVPRFDLVLEHLLNPLNRTAGQLMREIERMKQERQFVLEDEGSVPERYRKRVSAYFEALAEAEGRQ